MAKEVCIGPKFTPQLGKVHFDRGCVSPPYLKNGALFFLIYIYYDFSNFCFYYILYMLKTGLCGFRAAPVLDLSIY